MFDVRAFHVHEHYRKVKYGIFCCCLTDQTLQILQEAENQLVNSRNVRFVKREILELSSTQDLAQMLENIQRRLLG